jgi:hypothetical protein
MGEALEFFFGDMPVGYFEEPEYPNSPGRYRYMPYRGPGHYFMGEELTRSGAAQCSYTLQERVVIFVVRAVPKVHVLEIADFPG